MPAHARACELDANVKAEELRAAVKTQLAVLSDALDGSVAAIDVEKALGVTASARDDVVSVV